MINVPNYESYRELSRILAQNGHEFGVSQNKKNLLNVIQHVGRASSLVRNVSNIHISYYDDFLDKVISSNKVSEKDKLLYLISLRNIINKNSIVPDSRHLDKINQHLSTINFNIIQLSDDEKISLLQALLGGKGLTDFQKEIVNHKNLHVDEIKENELIKINTNDKHKINKKIKSLEFSNKTFITFYSIDNEGYHFTVVTFNV
ncbi:MAG: hypothetical protein WD512_02295 [Candidatus Paceibacterota bacterium]